MIAASRRSFITGLVALVAAPAIVRAGSLMAVNSSLVPVDWSHKRLMHELVEYVPGAGEAARLDVLYGRLQMRPEWTANVADPAVVMEDARRMYSFNSEAERKRFYANWEADYAFVNGEQWPDEQAAALRIRLPNDWMTSDGLGLHPVTRVYEAGFVPQIPDSLALAAAAVAIAPVVLAKPVTRRFWGK